MLGLRTPHPAALPAPGAHSGDVSWCNREGLWQVGVLSVALGTRAPRWGPHTLWSGRPETHMHEHWQVGSSM